MNLANGASIYSWEVKPGRSCPRLPHDRHPAFRAGAAGVASEIITTRETDTGVLNLLVFGYVRFQTKCENEKKNESDRDSG